MMIPDPDQLQHAESPARTRCFRLALVLVIIIASGLAGGYLLTGSSETSAVDALARLAAEQPTPETVALLPEQVTLPVAFGAIGPRLLDAGGIDLERFAQVYIQAGHPLTDEQLRILSDGSDVPITINRENAYFLLNFLWAFGLTNQNPILETGRLMQYSEGRIEVFASTGGWTLGKRPANALYASTPLVTLTPSQQARLEEVAYAVYRPCCNNHTAFADCNHGMAMLGLLELMAAQDATVDAMFDAAKNVSAFWFPQQMAEVAALFKAGRGQDFVDTDARDVVGVNIFSSAGFQAVHQWLAANNLLERVPGSGSSCGV